MDPVIFSRTDCVFHGGAKCQKYREIAEKNGGINKEGKKKGRRGGGKVKPRNLFPVKREQCGLSLVDISGSRAFSPAKFTDVWKISNSRESKTFLRQILYDGWRGGKKKEKKKIRSGRYRAWSKSLHENWKPREAIRKFVSLLYNAQSWCRVHTSRMEE